MFSSLEKLHLCFNNIQTISNISSHFPRLEKLKLINFESNKLESWSEVLKIGHLPQYVLLDLNIHYTSHILRKLTFCIFENKGADQLQC